MAHGRIGPDCENVGKRLSFSRIKKYPFETRVIFTELAGAAFPQDHCLSGLIHFLISYEARTLYLKYDQTTMAMRNVLEPQPLGDSVLSAEDAAKLRAINASTVTNKQAWDRLMSLFTIYRLIDASAHRNLTVPSLLTTEEIQGVSMINDDRQKCFTESVGDNARNKIKGWGRLMNWPDLLRTARITIEKLHLEPLFEDAVISSGTSSQDPTIDHLKGLSKRSVYHKAYYILDNFQSAGLSLSVIKTISGKEPDGTLPDLPDEIGDLQDLVDPHDKLEAKLFLAGLSAQQFRLPLQYTLCITPLCLLFPFPLYKTKCDRKYLFEASEALGNRRPNVLREIEGEILSVLNRISSQPKDLKTEIVRLVSSEKWRKLEGLPSTDPAFHFFDPSYGSLSLRPVEQRDSNGALPSSSPHKDNVPPAKGKQGMNADLHTSYTDQQGRPFVLVDETSTTTTPSAIGVTANDSRKPGFRMIHTPNHINALEPIVTGGNDEDIEMEPRSDKEDALEPIVTSADDEDIEMEPRSNKEDANMDVPDVDRQDSDRATSVHATTHESPNNGEEEMGEQETPNDRLDDDHEVNVQPIDDVATPSKPVRQSARIHAKSENEKLSGGTSNHVPFNATPQKQGRGPKRAKTAAGQAAAKDETPPTEAPVKEAPLRETIDVDRWMPKPITLDVTQKPPKVHGDMVIKAYSPDGTITHLYATGHDKKTVNMIQNIWKRVEAAYDVVLGTPLHLCYPDYSAFRVVTAEASAKMKPEEWLSILQTQNIAVAGGGGQPEPTLKKALLALGSLNTVMTIQDQSVMSHSNYNKRCMQGTPSQILEASRSPDGKILNALDIGLPAAGLKETGYATNVSALNATRGEWKTPQSLLMEEVNWALAATSGAFHTWHIDCNGFMTFISPICGSKLWIIGRPHVNLDTEKMADINLFLDEFELDGTNEKLWTLEAMLLKPGDTLIMRPNTPHTVYTPTPAVVHGGHCYSSTTLQASFVGMVHAFMAGSLITNTNHLSARVHLQQIIDFFHLALVLDGVDDDDDRIAHVPDCRSGSDFVNLMALCMFGILINVLDFATYQHPANTNTVAKLTKSQREEMLSHDVNILSKPDRLGCMYTRGQALQIMDTIARKFKMENEHDLSLWQSVRGYQENMIIIQCQMLFNYKLKASHLTGAPGCDLDLLKAQLSGVLDGEINSKIQNHLTGNSDSAMYLPELRRGLVAVQLPLSEPACPMRDPMEVGKCIRDRLYLDYQLVKVESNADEVSGSPLKKRQRS